MIRPDVGLGMGCIRELAEFAAAQIEQIADAHPGCKIDVIGHSMGGLVASYVLKRLDHGRRLRSVITLGTPHRGSPAAIFMQRVAGRFSAALAQMTPRSAFLNELAAAPVPLNCQLVSIAAANDGLVPPLYAQLPRRPRQRNRELEGLSHLGMLNSDEVVDVIGRLLQRAQAKRSTQHLHELERLRPSHAAVVLRFPPEKRAYPPVMSERRDDLAAQQRVH